MNADTNPWNIWTFTQSEQKINSKNKFQCLHQSMSIFFFYDEMRVLELGLHTSLDSAGCPRHCVSSGWPRHWDSAGWPPYWDSLGCSQLSFLHPKVETVVTGQLWLAQLSIDSYRWSQLSLGQLGVWSLLLLEQLGRQ